jgi:hypothetical protein
MTNMVRPHHCNTPFIKPRGHSLIATSVLSQAMYEQHTGFRILYWPVTELNTAGKAFHMVRLLSLSPRSIGVSRQPPVRIP